MIKRCFDLVVASVGLVVSAPVWLVIAVAIKFDSRGPVFHRAKRAGRHGTPFTIYKFRTMAVVRGPGITSGADARITRIGRTLRRTKLDELPQLLCVLKGDMSLVGPRPEDPRFVAGYTPEQRRVLDVRPGMTSRAALDFRDEDELLAGLGGEVEETYRTKVLPAKLELDLEYVKSVTFWADLVVLMRTALVLLEGSRREKTGC